MKNLFALLLAAALLLCLAACATANEKPADSTTEAATRATPELTEAAADTPAPTGDAAHISEIKTQLIGSWHFYGYEGVKLTFRDNGTGSYLGLDGTERSFLYLVTVMRGKFSNGTEYDYDMLKVEYDNGVSENIVIDFREEIGTKLFFHSFESDGYSGGYSGVIEFDDWTKDS